MTVDEVMDMFRALSPDDKVIVRYALIEELKKQAAECLTETRDDFISVEGI